MASPIKQQTNDLRSRAKEYQRDRNHNAKWARGFTSAPGKKCTHLDSLGWGVCAECTARPQHRDEDRRCGRHFSELKHSWNKKANGQKATTARKVFRNEVLDVGDNSVGASDSSAGEEDVKEASAAPVPDCDIMYSYDAVRGPGGGSDILGHAITQAVQRYENKETEKLVKEYEFVDGGKEQEGYAADADEDDFEMIDHATLN